MCLCVCSCCLPAARRPPVGNIFTHFAPLDWHGPRKAKENPYFDKDLRAKHHDQDHDEM